jgi:hypothetical protein
MTLAIMERPLLVNAQESICIVTIAVFTAGGFLCTQLDIIEQKLRARTSSRR